MMSIDFYQSLLHQPVEIQCENGEVLIGILEAVDQNQVYLKPIDTGDMRGESRDPGFFGPAFGPQAFWGGFAGSLLGIGLGTIIGIRPYGPYGPGSFPAYGPGSFPSYGPKPFPPYGPGPFY
ncbi:MAG: hypothetical protein LKI94_13270 [Sporolactobacillus sp.]|jgi:hypothetical protein|nr:hypothetical protein [Sporolactobacillus sp.]MCI1883150.1 hypothetical protein [Sporolactobacillus sp.]